MKRERFIKSVLSLSKLHRDDMIGSTDVEVSAERLYELIIEDVINSIKETK